MNTETTHTQGIDPLEALFASARQAQPNLMDDNFTKALMNSLPSINLVASKTNAKKGLSFDLIGAIIGIMVAYFFIDKGSLLKSFSGLLSDSVSITPLLLIIVVGTVALSSVVAWWAVEDNRL